MMGARTDGTSRVLSGAEKDMQKASAVVDAATAALDKASADETAATQAYDASPDDAKASDNLLRARLRREGCERALAAAKKTSEERSSALETARRAHEAAQNEAARDAAGEAASLAAYSAAASPLVNELAAAIAAAIEASKRLVELRKTANAHLAQFHKLGGDPSVRPLDGVSDTGLFLAAMAKAGVTVGNLQALRSAFATADAGRMAASLMAEVINAANPNRPSPPPHVVREVADAAEHWPNYRTAAPAIEAVGEAVAKRRGPLMPPTLKGASIVR